MKLVALFLVGCTGGSPLVESSPQVELTADPGNVAGGPLVRLKLTTWNHLAALGDAAESGQITATLDGDPLVLDPSSGYYGNRDSFIAAYIPSAQRSRTDHPTSSIVSVTDQETTWTVTIADLLSNDLQPAGPIVASQPVTLVWPSAASASPYSTIDWACAEIAERDAACQGQQHDDPGIRIAQQYIHVDVPSVLGDYMVITSQRETHPNATNGPMFLTSILNKTSTVFDDGRELPPFGSN